MGRETGARKWPENGHLLAPLQSPHGSVMRIARTAALLVLTAALTLAGCSGGRMPTSPSGSVTPGPVIPVITNGKVTIISIDGLRADAVQAAGAANILALA